MKKRTLLLCTLLFLMSKFGLSASERVPGKLIVWLHDGVRGKLLTNFVITYSQFGFQEVDAVLPSKNIHRFIFDPTTIDDVAFLNIIQNDSRVSKAYFNYYPTLIQMDEMPLNNSQNSSNTTGDFIPNDPDFPLQWVHENTGQIYVDVNDNLTDPGMIGNDLKTKEAWKLIGSSLRNSREIVIAVVDRNFMINHPELEFNFIAGDIKNDISPSLVEFDTTYVKGEKVVKINAHGTIVSGVISAQSNNDIGVAGMSFNNRLKFMPFDVFKNATPLTSNDDWYDWRDAFKFIIAQRRLYNDTGGAQGKYIIAVNLSMYLREAIKAPDVVLEFEEHLNTMGELGIISVTAAGNRWYNAILPDSLGTTDVGFDLSDYPVYPGACDSDFLITVAAINQFDVKNTNSNYGTNKVELGAPGDYVRLPRHDLKNDVIISEYTWGGATSVATPHVSGVLGLLYEAASDEFLNFYDNDPAGLAMLMKSFILNGVVPNTTLQGKTVTGGKLNAANSVYSFLENDDYIVRNFDSTISSQQFEISSRYQIYDGATLTIINSTILPTSNPQKSDYYGFRIQENSKLVIINSQVDVGFIRAVGENAEVHILGNSTVTINGEVLIDSSSLTVNNSSLTIKNAKLIMNKAKKVEFINESVLTTTDASEIIGHTTGFSNNPGSGLYIDGDFSILNLGLLTPGDRLTFIDSSLFCSPETKIYHPRASIGGRFDGIIMANTAPLNGRLKYCVLGKRVEGLHYIAIMGTNLSSHNTIIQHNTQMIVMSKSNYTANDMKYKNNTYGIMVHNSSISIDNSCIKNNLNFGLNLENLVGANNKITNSTISNNYDTGIQIRNGFVRVSNTVIEDNIAYGFHSLSTTPSYITDGSVISGHMWTEITALGNAFPMFRERHMPDYVKPVIPVSPYSTGHYYLYAYPPISSVIDARNLIVNTQNQNKFYPSFSNFLFDTHPQPPKALMMDALEYIIDEDFDLALETFKYIVTNYEDSEDAIHSLAIMPYLYQTLELDLADLNLYLDDYINHENLSSITLDTKARTMMYAEYYNDAIDLYDEIINTSDSEITQLLAIIDQMWCHLKLTENTRNLG